MPPPPQDVLVADDEADIRLLVRVHLGFEGWQVREVDDLERLLAAVRTPPRFLLLDAALPGLDGLDGVQQLLRREELAGTATVLLVGHDVTIDARAALAVGVDELVAKPFGPLQLSQTVGDLTATDPSEADDRRRLVLDRFPELPMGGA